MIQRHLEQRKAQREMVHTQHEQQVHDKHTCNARRVLGLRDVAQQPQSGLIVTGIACHGRGNRKTVLRDSQGAPPPTLLFFRSSHTDEWLPQLFVSVQYLFVDMKSPFVLPPRAETQLEQRPFTLTVRALTSLRRVMATTTVYPRLFSISITLSFRANVATLEIIQSYSCCLSALVLNFSTL